MKKAFMDNFLGNAPNWFKYVVLSFLIINPFVHIYLGGFASGWLLMVEFIFTLAMSLKCYPLAPGGLLALEAVALKMTSAEAVYEELLKNFPVLLLLMFMVAGIYFMREGLLFMFSKILIKIKSKVVISLTFLLLGAFLSAFLDALTVTAVIMAVAYGFYGIYHKVASGKHFNDSSDIRNDKDIEDHHRENLDEFRGFLRNLVMHGVVGTALGGAMTLVGEPQNLLIGKMVGWNFKEFFLNCAPVSITVFIGGVLTCVVLEKFKILGYGYKMPESIRKILTDYMDEQKKHFNSSSRLRLVVQAITAVLLILSLAFHIAEVGLIGLMVIILLTAFNGIVEEHRIGRAFEEALPFTALLAVFFAIVAVIQTNHLFKPVIDYVLTLEGKKQLMAYYTANGVLSAVSDNVFVATVYIEETLNHFKDIAPLLHSGLHISAPLQQAELHHLWKLAVAINMGTNIPSVATPNGQAAFLFLLTSSLAPLIRLSYMKMVKLALPYTVIMSLVGFVSVAFLL